MHISATLTLSTPLAPDMPLTDITSRISQVTNLFAPPPLERFELSTGYVSLQSYSVNTSSRTLFVSTDSAGNIDTWKLSMSVLFGGFRQRSGGFVSSTNIDTDLPQDLATYSEYSLCCLGPSSVASVNAVGSWTLFTPVPSSLLLFIPAVAIVGMRRVRFAMPRAAAAS